MAEKFTLKDALAIGDASGSVPSRFIAKIGIELEGGWDVAPPSGGNIVRDGSIVFGVPREEYEYLRANNHDPMRYTAARVNAGTGWVWKIDHRRHFATPVPPIVGELPSPPLLLKEWKKWLRSNYPQHSNETCGMHVHMSFGNALQYMLCMNKAYPATVVKEFTSWSGEQALAKSHPMWERLAAKSVYCQHLYDAELQAQRGDKGHNQHEPGHRYTVTNYAYNRTRTVECRLLPMMQSVEQAESAIQRLLNTTELFLLAAAKREKPRSLAVPMDQEVVIKERMIECV